MTSKQIKITEEPLLAPEMAKGPAISPTYHSTKDYRGSETESDFEGRSAQTWKSPVFESDRKYRPVSFTPTTEHHQFETQQSTFTSQHKPIEIIYPKHPVGNWQGQTNTLNRQPMHNAIETTNSMQMHEKSETNQRVVNMQSTTKIINFNNQLYGEPVPFPYSAASQEPNGSNRTRLAPPPTPTKFVKGDFRESDYESEVDSAKIRPVWTPIPSDSDDPRYRRVNAPNVTRSSSCPRSQQHQPPASPLEFDTQPPYQPVAMNNQPVAQYSTQTLDRSSSKKHHTTTMSHVQTKATEMSDQFKTFISGFEKMGVEKGTRADMANAEPQVYRDGSRVAQYGKSKIFIPFDEKFSIFTFGHP